MLDAGLLMTYGVDVLDGIRRMASWIRLDVDGQPSCDFLVARVLRPDSGIVQSDQQKRGCFGGGSKLAVFGLFLQTR